MYDKVTLYIDPETAPNYGGAVETIVNNLENVTLLNTPAGDSVLIGHIGGVTVTRYPNNVLISGSLPKYLYGNNIARLDRRGTAAAIEKLCDELHTDITTAKVTALEFGAVFTLARPIKEYYARFGNVPQMIRYIEVPGETIYYRTKGRIFAKQLAFYDKSRESAAAGVEAPPGLTNLLRYEMRLNKRLPQMLQEREVTARKLYNNTVYTKIMNKYKDNYFAIPKARARMAAPPANFQTSTDALNVFIAQYLVGKDKEFAQYVEALKDSNQLKNKVEVHRLRQKYENLKALYTTPLVDEDIIQELDDEITNLDNIL